MAVDDVRDAVLDHVGGDIVGKAVHVVPQLLLADILRRGPRDNTDNTGASPQFLQRLPIIRIHRRIGDQAGKQIYLGDTG